MSSLSILGRCKTRQHHHGGINIKIGLMEERKAINIKIGLMEERKAIKVTFFKEIYALDEPDDETEDTAGISEILRDSNKVASPELPQRRGRMMVSNRRGNAHLISNPVPADKVAEPVPPTAILEPPPTDDQVLIEENAMQSSEVNIARTKNKVATAARGKRKRGDALEILPEAQQLFKGLAFFFIPNNDIAPARRFRIRKTLERGAVWVKEWRENITHVIVDKNLTYQDILKFLKVSSFPSNMAVVNEDFTADCMAYQFIVNPQQTRYYLEGQKQVMIAQKPAPVPQIAEQKPAGAEGGNDHAPEKETTRLDENSRIPARSSPKYNEAQEPSSFIQKPDLVERTGANRNALDEAIEEAKAVKDLPLDLDEDESPASNTASEESDDAHSEAEKKSNAKKRLRKISVEDKFACMQKHDGANRTENPNARTIEILQQMADYYNRVNDNWRTIAYRRVIAALRKQDRKILTKEIAITIPFVGERLAAKIEEIVWTDRLRRLENTNMEPGDKVLQLFLNIYGVGFAQASTWINQGFQTLEDLSSKAKLSKNQKLGVEHYKDFLTRIPRKEVELHGDIVRRAIREADESIEVTIGGSYRRGAGDSGDVDFIITNPDGSIESLRTIMFETVIPRLIEDGYIKAALATSSKMDGNKWHGAATLPKSSIWRRIDFLLVPYDEMGAALIYFTGNDIFNRSIRLLASKKGMRLNQHGLWRDVIRGKNRERITQGSLVEGKSEQKIFEILGVPWRPPEHRIC